MNECNGHAHGLGRARSRYSLGPTVPLAQICASIKRCEVNITACVTMIQCSIDYRASSRSTLDSLESIRLAAARAAVLFGARFVLSVFVSVKRDYEELTGGVYSQDLAGVDRAGVDHSTSLESTSLESTSRSSWSRPRSAIVEATPAGHDVTHDSSRDAASSGERAGGDLAGRGDVGRRKGGAAGEAIRYPMHPWGRE